MNSIESVLYRKLSTPYAFSNNGNRSILWEKFKGFLDIAVRESTFCPGYSMGWRKYENEEFKISFRTGIINGKEFLDCIYEYNQSMRTDYIKTPLDIFDKLTKEGKQFFLSYYEVEIDNLLQDLKDEIITIEDKIDVISHEVSKLKTKIE